jgi:hypothetical protein
VKTSKKPKISCVHDSVTLLKELWNECTIEMQEEFKVMLLNRVTKRNNNGICLLWELTNNPFSVS